MPKILEREVNLDFPLGHHLHSLVAQIPIRLRRADHGYEIADPASQWRAVRSVLDLVAAGEQNLKKLHFLLFPEAAVPFARLDDLLALLDRDMRPNTVTIFGLEHVRLRTYRDLLARFSEENAGAIELVQDDVDSGDVLLNPVNAGCVVVKEASGRLRVYFEAKSHPFAGEEVLDTHADLYRGRHFYLFRCQPACFNFMVLVCLDYLYRSLYTSNIRQIIDHANRLFFTTRQTLDTLFVIQTNPKPEHAAYRDVLSGFYGEYLEDTPGVRETVTVFGNASSESVIDGYAGDGTFGGSSIVISRHHKLARISEPEFSTDDFGGAPLCRLRFGTETRLFYFNLPLHHELDPRSSRIPLKIHRVMQPTPAGNWETVSRDRLPAELVLPRDVGE
ncbi:MAG: hypothetical protein WCC48_08160 [Anaeromyxobacteraceae bacterium]